MNICTGDKLPAHIRVSTQAEQPAPASHCNEKEEKLRFEPICALSIKSPVSLSPQEKRDNVPRISYQEQEPEQTSGEAKISLGHTKSFPLSQDSPLMSVHMCVLRHTHTLAHAQAHTHSRFPAA